jgi:hypothetical protein
MPETIGDDTANHIHTTQKMGELEIEVARLNAELEEARGGDAAAGASRFLTMAASTVDQVIADANEEVASAVSRAEAEIRQWQADAEREAEDVITAARAEEEAAREAAEQMNDEARSEMEQTQATVKAMADEATAAAEETRRLAESRADDIVAAAREEASMAMADERRRLAQDADALADVRESLIEERHALDEYQNHIQDCVRDLAQAMVTFMTKSAGGEALDALAELAIPEIEPPPDAYRDSGPASAHEAVDPIATSRTEEAVVDADHSGWGYQVDGVGDEAEPAVAEAEVVDEADEAVAEAEVVDEADEAVAESSVGEWAVAAEAESSVGEWAVAAEAESSVGEWTVAAEAEVSADEAESSVDGWTVAAEPEVSVDEVAEDEAESSVGEWTEPEVAETIAAGSNVYGEESPDSDETITRPEDFFSDSFGGFGRFGGATDQADAAAQSDASPSADPPREDPWADVASSAGAAAGEFDHGGPAGSGSDRPVVEAIPPGPEPEPFDPQPVDSDADGEAPTGAAEPEPRRRTRTLSLFGRASETVPLSSAPSVMEDPWRDVDSDGTHIPGVALFGAPPASSVEPAGSDNPLFAPARPGEGTSTEQSSLGKLFGQGTDRSGSESELEDDDDDDVAMSAADTRFREFIEGDDDDASRTWLLRNDDS